MKFANPQAAKDAVDEHVSAAVADAIDDAKAGEVRRRVHNADQALKGR